MKHRSIIVLLVGLLLLSMTGVAAATVEKSGTQDCGMHGQTVRINSYASGEVRHYAPIGTHQETYTHTLMLTDSTTTNLGSATWRVTATGSLSSPNTYATCTGV